MKKATVQAPSNIAFIKYWGKQPGESFIPLNTSISMTLGACYTQTTIERSSQYTQDSIEFTDGTLLEKTSIKNRLAYAQIERVRLLSGISEHVRVMTRNSFPSDAGIASSASGFCALTGALLLAYEQPNLFEDKEAFSREVRLCGSGSAVRSVYGGFVDFTTGDDPHAIAHQIAPETHWDLVDIIAIVSSEKKKTSSSDGHQKAHGSPYLQTRLMEMQSRIMSTYEAVKDKNLALLGENIEADTLSMHAVMMTSVPPIIYFEPATLAVMREVMAMRNDGIQAYYTIDAGPNVHVICEKKDAVTVENRLALCLGVQKTLYNKAAPGAHTIETHLF